ncbi:hypothetical protein DFH08DRAFT_967493 [Mycena albidolilacea]|uniref:Glycan binding protein Y3-like domain-containing protein n=1 Tax=Mycena albidolilacea TaxID=1033008 RepID=A0AAD6ZLT8_9AGAR|nr:hypothetical protein DFH08DRAFT_967493 [Mycena albidolilacea]
MFSKLSNIVVIAAAIVTPVLGTLTCATTGSSFSCAAFIPTFCTALPAVSLPIPPVSQSILIMSFCGLQILSGLSYGRCYNRPGIGRCNFYVANTGSSVPRIPPYSDCVTALNTVAQICTHISGSDQLTSSIFKYTMTPSTGIC